MRPPNICLQGRYEDERQQLLFLRLPWASPRLSLSHLLTQQIPTRTPGAGLVIIPFQQKWRLRHRSPGSKGWSWGLIPAIHSNGYPHLFATPPLCKVSAHQVSSTRYGANIVHFIFSAYMEILCSPGPDTKDGLQRVLNVSPVRCTRCVSLKSGAAMGFTGKESAGSYLESSFPFLCPQNR